MKARPRRTATRKVSLDLSAWQRKLVRAHLLKTLARDGLEETLNWLKRGELRFALRPAAAAEVARHLEQGALDFAAIKDGYAYHLLERVWHELIARQTAWLWEDLRGELGTLGALLPPLGSVIETRWGGERDSTYHVHLGVALNLLTEAEARQSVLRPFMGSVYSCGRPTVEITTKGLALVLHDGPKHLVLRDFSAAVVAERGEATPFTNLRIDLFAAPEAPICDGPSSMLYAARLTRNALRDSGRPALAQKLEADLRDIRDSKLLGDKLLAEAVAIGRYAHLGAQGKTKWAAL